MNTTKSNQGLNIEMAYEPIIKKIENYLEGERPIIIGIDGKCGSGKSSLARKLAEKFPCEVFQMDDFFLPFEMKTKERLSEPGGNVHYERFLTEVMEPLAAGKEISYQSYDCQVRDFANPIEVTPRKINIIEGVYSFHPVLQAFYDWKVFLHVEPEVQKERIRQREGEEEFQNFINRWIPLENHYFNTLKIEQLADIIIDTSAL